MRKLLILRRTQWVNVSGAEIRVTRWLDSSLRNVWWRKGSQSSTCLSVAMVPIHVSQSWVNNKLWVERFLTIMFARRWGSRIAT